jgi:hypothetical protein
MTALARRVDVLEGRTPDGEPLVVAIVDDGEPIPAGANILIVRENVVTVVNHADTQQPA